MFPKTQRRPRFRAARAAAVAALLALWIVLPAADALARAGSSSGGSSRSSSSGSSSSFSSSRSSSYRGSSSRSSNSRPLTPGEQARSFGIFLAVAAVMFGGPLVLMMIIGKLFFRNSIATHDRESHERESRELIKIIAQRDASWQPDVLGARVEAIYFKVQEAWTRQDQDLARGYCSERLDRKHRADLADQKASNIRNVLEDIRFLGCEVMFVADRVGKLNDEVLVRIRGAMTDFEQLNVMGEMNALGRSDSETRAQLRARNDEMKACAKRGEFTETWKLVWMDGNWVLDEINPFNAPAAAPFSDEVESQRA